MSSRLLLAGLTIACCLVAAAAGAETLVVVESSATDVKVGAELADGATITVPEGARVVLVGASGQVVTLTGPFQGAPKTSGSGEQQSRVLAAVASLVATSGTTVGVSRATGSGWRTGAAKPAADVLAIGASRAGAAQSTSRTSNISSPLKNQRGCWVWPWPILAAAAGTCAFVYSPSSRMLTFAWSPSPGPVWAAPNSPRRRTPVKTP